MRAARGNGAESGVSGQWPSWNRSTTSSTVALRREHGPGERERGRPAKLGVAPSTAHRLLATLRYRGFVVQGRDRAYRPGPAMEELVTAGSCAPISRPSRCRICNGCATRPKRPLMRWSSWAARCGSSPVASRPRCCAWGSATGPCCPPTTPRPAGCCCLRCPPEQFDAAYPKEGVPQAGLTASAVAGLRRDLAVCRKTGYAVNAGQTERGLTAVGVMVAGADGPVGGISVSLPSVRYPQGQPGRSGRRPAPGSRRDLGQLH